MNPEEIIITGLTDAQADGLACMNRGRDYLRASWSVSPLVGQPLAGSQVFADEVCCGVVAGADPTMAPRRVGGDCR